MRQSSTTPLIAIMLSLESLNYQEGWAKLFGHFWSYKREALDWITFIPKGALSIPVPTDELEEQLY